MSLASPGSRLHPVRLAREAFALPVQGSRDDLAEISARRVPAALLLLWLTGRCVHLTQAGIDLAAGHSSYAPLLLAAGLAAGCLAESALVALRMVRARQLTLGALLADALFGVAGLAAMSVATAGMPGRDGSLNWMLPYTVATVTGLGLLPAGFRAPEGTAAADAADLAVPWRWPLVVTQIAAVAGLAAAYLLSVYLPYRVRQDKPTTLWANAANYVGFFAAATIVAWLLRRWLMLIGQRNAEAARAAGDLSREALWRALAADVFGPVLKLLDDLAECPGEVPAPMRAEAGRLIELIEAVKPRASAMAAIAGSDAVPGTPGGRQP